jgi:hypothetical protein
VGLVHGAITTYLSLARLEPFDYGRLRYGQFAPQAWSAYARRTFEGIY